MSVIIDVKGDIWHIFVNEVHCAYTSMETDTLKATVLNTQKNKYKPNKLKKKKKSSM